MQIDSISPGALQTEEDHRRNLCVTGRWMYDHGFVAATEGNLSVRLGPRQILATPRGVSKGMMSPEDLVVTDLEDHKTNGGHDPSSEIGMHLLIYRCRPDVNAVCHAHPPAATGYAAAGVPLNKAILAEPVICLSAVPVAPYGTPGTPELAGKLEPFVRAHDAMLMANHGVVTYGPDLLTAFYRMETVEHFARVALVTELLGKQVLLSGKDVEKLLAARARYGIRTVSESRPLTSDSAEAEKITLTRRELEAIADEAVQRDRSRR